MLVDRDKYNWEVVSDAETLQRAEVIKSNKQRTQKAINYLKEVAEVSKDTVENLGSTTKRVPSKNDNPATLGKLGG